MIAAALRSALSDRARNDRIHAVTEARQPARRRRPRALSFLAPATTNKKVLVVIGRSDEVGASSVRNLPGVRDFAGSAEHLRRA